jgi:hypothetical protein
MTEREFRFWLAYRARKLLPSRRLELYLAQIALVSVQAATRGQHLKLSDFMFDEMTPIKRSSGDRHVPPRDAFAGMSTHVLGKKRRKSTDG